MDLIRKNLRSMIFYDFECSLTVQQNLAYLRTTFDDKVPCKKTTYNWFSEFKRGRVNLGHEFRDGSPPIDVNNKKINAVRRMIETQRHMIYHEIQTS
ncbi:hypothetical protein EVAR_79310_1 [Eumeta japonica]|uniref:Mos1 transposase HTH domain-containing protein n=1 Tax=Eumeta variegata TaxID=151549 RepID=A0A4C1TES8_EUMVA|nr:hypothetical protein EVAR_79310_1 [Eumeta japonica]